jgi:hypothetical protein
VRDVDLIVVVLSREDLSVNNPNVKWKGQTHPICGRERDLGGIEWFDNFVDEFCGIFFKRVWSIF